MTDHQLLHEYAVHRDERAFRELVARYTDFVYSAARRQVQDHHAAEDVTQATFILLSKRAARITEQTSLAGWLYQVVHFTCRAARRTEARRQFHERKAGHMRPQSHVEGAPPPAWEQLAPVLDDAIARLSERDRDAVLLRFMRKLSLKEVGAALGLSEDAAEKRVSRAIDKIRQLVTAEGITVSSAGLVALISGHSVGPAPAITSAASANAATLAVHAGKMMPAGPAKALLAASLLVALLATTIFAVSRHGRTPAGKAVAVAAPIPSTSPSLPGGAPPPFTLRLTNGATMELVGLAAGDLLLGDRTVYQTVRISRPFYMGRHEVTQAQWRTVMGTNPSQFTADEQPVETVSWSDCQAFCAELSRRAGKHVRLPSEAEWEYACRAGTRSAYSFGDDPTVLPLYAWQAVTEEGNGAVWGPNFKRPQSWNFGNASTPQRVGQKRPNPWGLHDMHGNVWEWCEDDFAPGGRSIPLDGSARKSSDPKSRKVARGGCWGSSNAAELKSASRVAFPASRKSEGQGFRIVVEVNPGAP